MVDIQQQYRVMFEHMAQGAFFQLADGTLVDVNPAALAMFGLTRDQFLGRTSDDPAWRVIREDGTDLTPEQHPSMVALRTGQQVRDVVAGVYNPTRKSFVWLTINAIPMFWEGEATPYQTFVTLHDITELRHSELLHQQITRQYEVLTSTSMDGYWVIDGSGRIIDANDTLCRVYGYSREELIGKHLREFDVVEDEAAMQEHMAKIMANGYDRFETRHYRKDGSEMAVEVSTAFIPETGVFLAFTRDITEQKMATIAMRESEARFRAVMENIQSIAVQGYLMDGTVIFWNRASEQLYGYSAAEALGANLLDLIIPEEMKQDVVQAVRQMVATNEPIPSGELALKRKDTTLVPVYSSHALIHPPGRQPELFCLDIDLTERKQVEVTLLEIQELFSLFMKYSPVYTFIKQIEGEQSRVMLASDNFIDLVGRPAAEMVGRTMEELFPADFARKITADDLAVIREGKVVQLDEDLGDRNFSTIKFPITREGKSALLAGFTIDITERKQNEIALQEREQKYRTLISTIQDAIFLTNADDGKIIECNEQLSGYSRSELLGKSTIELGLWANLQERQQVVDRVAAEGSVQDFVATFRKKDGTLFQGSISTKAFPLRDKFYLLSVVRDISGRKRAEQERLELEKQLLHAQKLESLGVLAGGIAHDFNNILMSVLGNAELAIMGLNPESPAVNNLQKIEQAALRAAELARQMLAYSGKGKFVVEVLDLNRLLEEMLHMLEVSISKKAVLRLNLTRSLPAIHADPSQIRQVAMNLVINASDALGDSDGVIAVTTGIAHCTREYLQDAWLNNDIPDGTYIFLEVADTGCGMDAATMAKIFDPFFSTKFTGRGLGMAAVLGIVKGHKGAIKVHSELGKGTTFTVLFPASDRVGEESNRVKGPTAAGGGMVLLVDDEETVRGLGGEMLKLLGYDVITASNGQEAVDLFRHRRDIAFVVLDLTMPLMDGEQTLHALRALDPDVKVIIASGYSEHDVAIRFAGQRLAGVLQKPFSIAALREVMHAAAR